MRYILILMLLLTVSGCWKRPEVVRKDVLSLPADNLTMIIEDYATELKYDMHLSLEDARVAWGKRHRLILNFTSQDILELRDARALLVDLVEGLLQRVNGQNLVVGDPISHFYTPYEIDINIQFESFYARYADPKYMGAMLLQNGIAYYYAGDVLDRDLSYWHKRVETYYKSRSIVQAERAAEEHYREAHPAPKKAEETLNLEI